MSDIVKRKAGRIAVFDVQDIIANLELFIDNLDKPECKHFPRVLDFCASYGISKTRLYELCAENDELEATVKKIISKEELYLVSGGERGTIPVAFAIFRLKQRPFNYTDKQEHAIMHATFSINAPFQGDDDKQDVLDMTGK